MKMKKHPGEEMLLEKKKEYFFSINNNRSHVVAECSHRVGVAGDSVDRVLQFAQYGLLKLSLLLLFTEKRCVNF